MCGLALGLQRRRRLRGGDCVRAELGREWNGEFRRGQVTGRAAGSGWIAGWLADWSIETLNLFCDYTYILGYSRAPRESAADLDRPAEGFHHHRLEAPDLALVDNDLLTGPTSLTLLPFRSSAWRTFFSKNVFDLECFSSKTFPLQSIHD